MSCAYCGARLPDGANYCPNCGNRVRREAPEAPPPPDSVWRRPDPSSRPALEPVPPPAVPAPVVETPPFEAAPAPEAPEQAPSAQATPEHPRTAASPAEASLSAFEVTAFIGLAVAVLGTVLPWVTSSLGSFEASASGWSGLAEFRLAGWLGTGWPVDAIAVVLLAAVAALLRFSGVRPATKPDLVEAVLPAAGALIAVIGALNWYYIESTAGDFNVNTSIGAGLYALIAGGVIAAACALLDERQEVQTPRPEAT